MVGPYDTQLVEHTYQVMFLHNSDDNNNKNANNGQAQ
jgi:hypothetical protein